MEMPARPAWLSYVLAKQACVCEVMCQLLAYRLPSPRQAEETRQGGLRPLPCMQRLRAPDVLSISSSEHPKGRPPLRCPLAVMVEAENTSLGLGP